MDINFYSKIWCLKLFRERCNIVLFLSTDIKFFSCYFEIEKEQFEESKFWEIFWLISTGVLFWFPKLFPKIQFQPDFRLMSGIVPKFHIGSPGAVNHCKKNRTTAAFEMIYVQCKSYSRTFHDGYCTCMQGLSFFFLSSGQTKHILQIPLPSSLEVL